MTETEQTVDPEWLTVLSATHSAVLDYAAVEFDKLVQRVIYRMQRFPAVGIYSDHYRYKSAWDEYCHEVQNGPFDLPGHLGFSPSSAWKESVEAWVMGVISSIPQHQSVLLTIAAMRHESLCEIADVAGSSFTDALCEELTNMLSEQASMRDLDRFDPM